MARKSEDDILRDGSSLWVEKYHFEPTDDDIRDMRKAIGKEQRFLELSYENRELLFRGMLRVRRVDEMYRDLSASGTEDPDPMRAALEKFVGAGEREFRPSRYSCKAVGRAAGD